jgi:hypothetical protein
VVVERERERDISKHVKQRTKKHAPQYIEQSDDGTIPIRNQSSEQMIVPSPHHLMLMLLLQRLQFSRMIIIQTVEQPFFVPRGRSTTSINYEANETDGNKILTMRWM